MYAVKEIIPISCACDFVCAAYDKCYTCDFGYTWYRSITVWFLIFLGDLEFQKIKQGPKDIAMQK